MPPKPGDVYNPVPSVSPDTSGGNDYISARATPEAFGSQVGEAEQKAGGAAQQIGGQAVDLATHLQGMYNETAATNADAELAKRVGDIKGQYFSKSGQEAFDALPAYQASLDQARQDIRSNLPPGAAHSFDMLATRSIANNIADGSVHAVQQLKAAQIDAGSSLQNNAVRSLADPSVAPNPTRVGEQLADIHWGAQMQLPNAGTPGSGIKKDPDTGVVSFDESTPEGKAAKAQFQRNVDSMVAQGQVNRFNTLSKFDPLGAFQTYQQERDNLPRSAQVQLDADFGPKVFDAHKQNVTGTVLADASQAHQDMLFNPPTAASSAINTVMKNEGGMNPSDGNTGAPALYGINAKYHPTEFAEASKIRNDQGEQAAQDYAKQFYKTEYYDKKGIGDLPANTQTIVMDGVVNHSPTFGDKLIAAAKDGASPQQLIDMRRQEYNRLATSNPSEYGANLAGWNNRLDGLQSASATSATPPGAKPYGTNPDGSPLTQADYYKGHSQDVYARGDAYAEQTMPGNLQFKHAVHESLSNFMSTTITNQQATYDQDNRFIQRAVNGEFTKGVQPTTMEQLKAIQNPDGTSIGDVMNRSEVHSPKYMEGVRSQISEAANHTPGYFSGVNFNDPTSVASATQLAVAQAGRSGSSVSETMWNPKDAAKFNDQWSSLPLNADKDAGTNGKIQVLRTVRDAAGPYASDVFSALKKTYPNAAYAAAIPDDKTAGEILMGDERIKEDKVDPVTLSKVDGAMHDDGYDKALLPQQYDQVKAAARSIFAARYSSGQEPSEDDIKGAVKSALGGMDKTSYSGKPLLTPIGVSGSQMDKFLSNIDNNDIVAGMNNAQKALSNGGQNVPLELPRGKGGETFQVGQTPFSLQSIAPGMYMVMQPNGNPYPAQGMKGGKMIVQFNPQMITATKPEPAGSNVPLTDMGI